MTKSKDLFGKWKHLLLSDPSWEPMFVFGPRPPKRKLSFSSTREFEILRQKHIRFRRKLIGLGQSIGVDLDLDSKQFSISNTPFLCLGSLIANQLGEALASSWDSTRILEDEYSHFLLQKDQIKPGRRAAPRFFLEHVLVGLELFKGSKDRLTCLKRFIEPGGGLDCWLDIQCSSVEILSSIRELLISFSGHDEFIFEWARSKRQSYVRALLTFDVGCAVKSYDQDTAELASTLKSRIKYTASSISS